MANKAFTLDESRILREGRAAGLSYGDIAKMLPGRNYWACKQHGRLIGIAKKRVKKALLDNGDPAFELRMTELTPQQFRAAAISANHAFGVRLIDAIRSGNETSPKVCRRLPKQFTPARQYQRAIHHSGCSSSAALCADSAGSDIYA